jgi:serine protease
LPSLGFTVERIAATGHALLRLDAPVSHQAALRIAASLGLRPGVRYAEPVGRVVVQKVPDDAQLPAQWALGQGAAGINATEAWDITSGGPVTVAVIDTGILPHPDLSGKILPGYDFVSDPDSARDGDGRDADATDPGDASTADDECGAKRSSWHGTFVAGIVAAATNNGIGVAGVSWGARILPVRVLGKCGGTFEDVVDGILWAGGVPVADAPANPYPARILNLSLGGETGGCPDYVQEAIDLVIARGAIPVIAAGNVHGDVYDESPAGCGGVIAVTAIDRDGDLASYSNAGAKADLGAPGGDASAAPTQTLVLGLRNAGTDRAGAFTYGYGAGTSFAAPHVAGVLALMLTRNPGLTYGQMLNILFDSARSYRLGTRCSQLSAGCGAGIVDANSALLATPDLHGLSSAPDLVTVVEFLNRDLQHYFMTASPVEIDAIDAGLAGTGWSRTGYAFRTVPITGAEEVMRPVCRFYGRPGSGPNSHFYTASAAECALLQVAGSAWMFEGWVFGVDLPQDGRCRPGYKPLYRAYNQRAFANDANHRYLIDIYEYIRMQQRGWLPEGVVMCIVND